jgi:predicted tellurium resistance membrane protein TerC
MRVNAVFSFDSIPGAMALTDNFIVMAMAIIIGGILLVLLADHVTDFLKKNRMYEVVGLFILFLVGSCCYRKARMFPTCTCSAMRSHR